MHARSLAPCRSAGPVYAGMGCPASNSAVWCTVHREDHPRSCCSSTESTSGPMGHLWTVPACMFHNPHTLKPIHNPFLTHSLNCTEDIPFLCIIKQYSTCILLTPVHDAELHPKQDLCPQHNPLNAHYLAPPHDTHSLAGLPTLFVLCG